MRSLPGPGDARRIPVVALLAPIVMALGVDGMGYGAGHANLHSVVRSTFHQGESRGSPSLFVVIVTLPALEEDARWFRVRNILAAMLENEFRGRPWTDS
ncbi:hypothetical protein KM043_007531 [Ampulex compressa]|nr:hypothetical protein KM043_007531 [Ampulex compressa]